METFSINPKVFSLFTVSVFVLFSGLFFTTSSIASTKPISTKAIGANYQTGTSKFIQYARRRGRNWRRGYHRYPYYNTYYGHRGGYWTSWRRVSRHCYRRCFVNRWGHTIRCRRSCR